MKHAFEIDIDHLRPLLRVDAGQSADWGNHTRVIYQNINAAKRGLCGADCSVYGRIIGDIAGPRHGARPDIFRQFDNLGFAARQKANIGARRGKCGGSCRPNATAGTGDNGCFAGEVFHKYARFQI